MHIPSPRTGLLMLQERLERRKVIRTRARSARHAHSRLVRHYRPLVARGDLVFDIGANRGMRTAAFRALGARVVAVEPQPECAAHLRQSFGDDRDVIVVEAAAGRAAGTQTLHLNKSDTLASMASDWIDATNESGRFGEWSEWVGEVEVQVTTLDALIAEHGLPAFCKVDVEGYEPEVLEGLTRAVSVVSYEFTPETPKKALRCVDALAPLGADEFTVSLRESAKLQPWRPASAIREFLLGAAGDLTAWGDVYARFPQDEAAHPR